MPSPSRTPLARILLGGFVAGTVDIVAAALINLISPIVIMRYVAMGVLGRRSLEMGIFSAALGMSLQWAMSILIAAIFVFAGGAVPAIRRHWAGAGLAYGVVVFFVMEYVVVPLSAMGRVPHFTAASFAENMVAMLLFGVIVAYFARDVGRDVALRIK